MLRLIVLFDPAAVRSYFAAGDGREYYADSEEAVGKWGGKAAGRLGLGGWFGPGAFRAMCENRHPHSGGRLTPRTKTRRRVGWDVSFNAPKSVSVVYGLTGHRSIVDAFKAAVRETMTELESAVRTRVRVGGRDETRMTGNLVYALFAHATARPMDGIPDPHLHAHCLVFNTTFDPVEGRWKAAELAGVYRDAPYYEAAFHARLAGRLAGLGFDIVRTPTGWELGGVPERVRTLFSRRTTRIDALAAELGITDPARKGALGARTRERKQHRFTLGDLRQIWAARLTPAEREAVAGVAGRGLPRPAHDPQVARDAVEFAIGRCFEREPVVGVKRLQAMALRHGVGRVTPAELTRDLSGHDLVLREYGGERVATTRKMLAEEHRIFSFAKEGRGTCRPLAPDSSIPEWLTPGQRTAVYHVLSAADRVVVVQGALGHGTTPVIRACVNAIRNAGHPVQMLAPGEAGRSASREAGFTGADTVARFLADSRFRETARRGCIWLDEAGSLGTGLLDSVFRCAAELDARVVLSGGACGEAARGSPFTLLSQACGLQSVAVRDGRRRTRSYRNALSLLQSGRVGDAFDVLDHGLGWVKELPEAECATAIAADYSRTVAAGKSVLVITPTAAEGEAVTRAVRADLRAAGVVAAGELLLGTLVARDLAEAELRQPDAYRSGDVIEFHARADRFRPGTRLTVRSVRADAVTARDRLGHVFDLPIDRVGCYRVYYPAAIAVAPGDRVRVTKAATTAKGKRLIAGTIRGVVAVSAAGVELDNGVLLPADFGHLAHGYVVTGRGARVGPVDRVLLAQPSRSFDAGPEPFSASCLLARESLAVYTDDKPGLRRAVWCNPEVISMRGGDRAGGPPPGWRTWVERRLGSRGRIIGDVLSTEPRLRQDVTVRGRSR